MLTASTCGSGAVLLLTDRDILLTFHIQSLTQSVQFTSRQHTVNTQYFISAHSYQGDMVWVMWSRVELVELYISGVTDVLCRPPLTLVSSPRTQNTHDV